eukprot:TRINITY_DN7929_c0_g1_i1.p1 TRINITY_DN7929_c0_g1~~TRINITY_DN7929_c0_g1_i1.p1  ORF type:complete len:561 (-),score=134.46 TRINITY_DN7929_c0_g1_i1:106-1788(-)
MKTIMLLLALPLVSPSILNPLCDTCRFLINIAHNILASDFVIDHLIIAGKYICSFIQPASQCELLIGNFRKPVVSIVHALNSVTLCSQMRMCTSPRVVEDEDHAYFSQVLTSVPPRLPYTGLFNVSDTYKILVFTDAHVDFSYTEGRSGKCNNNVCCRGDSPMPKRPQDKAGKFGHIAKCDLPQITLDSFIQTVGKLNPDVVLSLGDYNGHNAHEQTENTHLRIVEYIGKNLRGNYSGPVYLVTGNHDGFPDGQFDVRRGQSQWILDGYADIAKHWYSNEGVESVRKYGRFSERVNGTRLRIIGLNNFVMDYTNLFLYENGTDALGQFKWLEEQLELTANNNEFAIIIGHVAPQSKSGERTWGLRYAALMERYANVIKGQFFGHMHEDYFYPIMSFMDPSNLVSVVNIHPALTTYSTVNPSFRVYEMDKNKYDMVEYHQYRLDVKEANARGEANWEIAYNFTGLLNFTNMHPENYLKLLDEMKNTEFFNKMYSIMYTGGPKGYGPPTGEARARVMCKFTTAHLYDFLKCTNETFKKFGDYMRFLVAGKYLFPKWKYAVGD